jgi:hypothetical protein
LRTGIVEFYGKDGKLMLRGKSAKHCPMATPNGIVARYFVIENGDAQAEFP